MEGFSAVTNFERVTITIPADQQLTTEALRALMNKVKDGGELKPTNGKRNIRIELFFLALGFNLKKRWMKQQKSRLETHYSEKKAS